MRREFFPLFCQFFQIFVYIILNLAIGQLVGFGEDDREGYSIFSQPFHKFQVYFLRLQTAVWSLLHNPLNPLSVTITDFMKKPAYVVPIYWH